MNITANSRIEGDKIVTEIDGKITSRDLADHIIIPAFLLDYGINPRAMLLYGLLHSFLHSHKTIFASNEFMANTLNTSERNITKLLKELEDIGLIEIAYKDKQKRHRQEIFCINPFYEAQNDRRKQLRLNKRSLQTEQMDSLDRTNVPHNKEVNKQINNIGSKSQNYADNLNRLYKKF